MKTPIVHLKPHMTEEEMLTHVVVSLDGTPFVQTSSNDGRPYRRWSVVGMGFVGGLMEPFTDEEILAKAKVSTDIAVLPDLGGNNIIVLKGCSHLVDKFA